jgi:protoporphyrin/coproporphyrin ferrochelatase
MSFFRAVSAAPVGAPERIGVLVVNLGTPDALSYWSIRRYLRQFLSDRRVIDSPRLTWLPILETVVLGLRPFRNIAAYRRVWMPEGSPLAVLSKRLTAKIDGQLKTALGDRVRVELAMTYGEPAISDAVQRLAEQNVRRLLVLPLYPQYCSSTTGSVFDAVTRVLQRWRWLPELRFVNHYFDQPTYSAAIAASVSDYWQRNAHRSHLLFSFHGVPQSYVSDGDPYFNQSQATVASVVQILGLSPVDWSLSFQSRFGPVEWLKPYTIDKLRELAARGIRRLTVVSPSFAVDCLETLEEIGVEYRHNFVELGGEKLDLVPALNDSDRHAALLAEIARQHMAGWHR